MNKLFKRIMTIGMGLVMAAAVAVPAMAEGGTTDPANPAPTAKIDVSKLVKTTIDDVFPSEPTYQFVLKPLSVETALSGASVTGPENMPMPASTGTEGTSGYVKTEGTGADKTSTLTVGDFTTTTDGTNTATQRTRVATFTDITYKEAGLYTYELTETRGDAVGVAYDTTKYYVEVYVVNVKNSDGTPYMIDDPDDSTKKIPQVTIEAITLWKANATNPTGLTILGGDTVVALETDKTKDGKHDIGKPEGTNNYVKITAPFKNTYPDETLTVKKTVTGNLADPNKEFTFTFTPNNLNGEQVTEYSYAYQVYKADGTTKYVAADLPGESTLKKFGNLTNATGDNTFNLKHGERVEIYGVHAGLNYTVKETAADGYYTKIDWQNGSNKTEDAQSGTVGALTAEGSKTEITNTIQDTTLSEEEVGAEGFTRDNHAYFTNHKEATTPTGVLLRVAPFALLAVLLVAGIAYVAISGKRRKNGYQGL